ncbi:hypothetical protein GWI33_018481 [Rhynchophorus ferrugineus]|uniref:C2H2-type domain-containing protein n=1 Tax=Rhynchophorus ferrugineus TaxID=354439 RepID=A0A834M7Z6_RHYFE|nr:hypothetical protein GWI33_018481 [Rhynchophorus ferrugineus]
MTELISPLKPELGTSPTLLDALELVMDEYVDKDKKYPNSMCAMCREFLKISYDLKVQYKESQEQLKNCFKSSEKEKNCSTQVTATNNEDKEASVEIVVGSQKFDIQNVLIVEDDDEKVENYDAFLDNLGTNITASYVNKDYRPKLSVEPPHLVIEKVNEAVKESTHNESLVNNDASTIIEEQEEKIEDIQTEEPKNVNFDNNERDISSIDLNMKYKCPVCGKLMLSLPKAKIHAQNCGKKKSAKCYVCGEQFPLRKELLQHLKTAHVINISKDKTNKIGKHECYICNQIFSSYGSLAYHMSKHQGRRYNCDICDKWFYTKNQVDIHKQIHNRDKTLVICPICGKGFHYQSGLFYHMKIHTNERNYKCVYCPRSFYTKNSVKRHELTHTGARPYDCKFCDKKFRSLGEVKKHQFLHTGERPYHCKYCNMTFIQMHNLKVHLMTHSGDFQCNYCIKNFADEDILKFHLQNKHQIKQTDQMNDKTESYETPIDEDDIEATDQFEAVHGEAGTLIDGQVLEEEYFIMEDDFVSVEEGAMSDLIVKTYEVQNEVLVEAIEDSL